jgi:hypothetical protein
LKHKAEAAREYEDLGRGVHPRNVVELSGVDSDSTRDDENG